MHAADTDEIHIPASQQLQYPLGM